MDTLMCRVFNLSSWDANSGPYACVASALFTKPFLQAICTLFFGQSLTRGSVSARLAEHGDSGHLCLPIARITAVSSGITAALCECVWLGAQAQDPSAST